MLSKGYTQSVIASTINKHKSVISREIKRNRNRRNGKYDFDLAQRKCDQRHKEKAKHVRLTPEMRQYIVSLLEQQYSPEQIKGVSDVHGIDCVSHERIYLMIYTDKSRKGDLHKNLRNKGRPYRKRGALKDKRGMIPNRVDISERPDLVQDRNRFGDLEIDTIVGKNHKSSILTINDRMTGVLRMSKLEARTATVLADKTIELLSPWHGYLKTITSDNGYEFGHHERIADKLAVDFYFARPYHSWERGSNENLNRLVRQYIPKGTDFNLITDEYIKFVEQRINDRPRKRFGFLSPNQVLKQKVAFIN
jgi:transposase, IS30 family